MPYSFFRTHRFRAHPAVLVFFWRGRGRKGAAKQRVERSPSQSSFFSCGEVEEGAGRFQGMWGSAVQCDSPRINNGKAQLLFFQDCVHAPKRARMERPSAEACGVGPGGGNAGTAYGPPHVYTYGSTEKGIGKQWSARVGLPERRTTTHAVMCSVSRWPESLP